MNNQRYTYANLGESCQTSLSVLSNANKFLPLNNPEYDAILTKTYEYPRIMREKTAENEKFEAKKTTTAPSCCGKKYLYGI